MREIELTQGKMAIVDDEDFEWLNSMTWCAARKTTPNAVRFVSQTSIWDRENERSINISMHQMIMGRPLHGLVIDHVNGDPLDNRRANLRYATLADNVRNRKKYKATASRFKGIYWEPERQCWRAAVWIGGKQKRLGRFKEERDAAAAYNEGAKLHYGAFALLNDLSA
jgi:hypothetical protein